MTLIFMNCSLPVNPRVVEFGLTTLLYILKIIALLYIPIRFITFLASKVILYGSPYTLFVVYIHRATC